MRPDLPAQPTFRTGCFGATFWDDEDVDRYQLHAGIDAKVAVMHRDGERPHGSEEASAGGSQSGNEYTERETF